MGSIASRKVLLTALRKPMGHTPVGRKRSRHLGSGQVFSRVWRRREPPHPPGGRSGGRPNPRRPPQLQPQNLGRHAAVADGEALQIPAGSGSGSRSPVPPKQKEPVRKVHPAAHPRLCECHQVSDQPEIACSRGVFGNKEQAFPPTSIHAANLRTDA